MKSYGDSGDQAIDVSLGIVKMWRYANISFAEAGDNFFLHELMIKLGGFLGRARGKATVGAALRGIERAGRDAAVFREGFEKQIDQIAIMGVDGFGSKLQDELEGSVHGGEVEIVRGFGDVPTARAASGLGVFKGKGVKIFGAFGGSPVKRARAHFVGVLVFGPEKPGSVRAEQPFVSGTDHKIGTERG